MSKELSVAAIKKGTVIDHIPAGAAMKIVRTLRLVETKKTVTLGLNLPSRSMGHKDLIKVQERALTPQEAAEIAIFAPTATINIIEDYKVVQKYRVEMPRNVEGVILCLNPHCITNHEEVVTRFAVHRFGKVVEVECLYCSKVFSHDAY